LIVESKIKVKVYNTLDATKKGKKIFAVLGF
jgi:hypothetical protein